MRAIDNTQIGLVFEMRKDKSYQIFVIPYKE